MALPGTTEKLSHGEPTFFAGGKRVFAMLSNNHHNDGHLAVWIPAPPGLQEALVQEAPNVYYRPPYVGVKGWIGIELERIGDEVAEPVVYMIDRYVVGGFYRAHGSRERDQNLNAPGMHFVPLGFEHTALPDTRAKAGAAPPNRFYM